MTGETPIQFRAKVADTLEVLANEPESTAREIALTLGLDEDTTGRLLIHLLSERRILATVGRHKIPTYRVNPLWTPPDPTTILSPFSASLRTPNPKE